MTFTVVNTFFISECISLKEGTVVTRESYLIPVIQGFLAGFFFPGNLQGFLISVW